LPGAINEHGGREIVDLDAVLAYRPRRIEAAIMDCRVNA